MIPEQKRNQIQSKQTNIANKIPKKGETLIKNGIMKARNNPNVDKRNRFLFKTSETDSHEVFRGSDNNFYVKRIGLPIYQIDNEYARSIAWFEANRRGWFLPFRVVVEGEIPHLTNEPAQQRIVNELLNI